MSNLTQSPEVEQLLTTPVHDLKAELECGEDYFSDPEAAAVFERIGVIANAARIGVISAYEAINAANALLATLVPEDANEEPSRGSSLLHIIRTAAKQIGHPNATS